MIYDSIQTFKIWAPDESVWSLWAKPVLFAKPPQQFYNAWQKQVPDIGIENIPPADASTAIIADLPDSWGVLVGMELAGRGYRPVPLYNGVFVPKPVQSAVEVEFIVWELFDNADALLRTGLPADAPPAFLLDSKRMAANKNIPGTFDNRWQVFPQDLPSASFLYKNGVRRIVLLSDTSCDDLAHVLYRYQEGGLNILSLRGGSVPIPFNVQKPSMFRHLAYRAGVLAGLKRNPTGGFGGMVPVPGARHG